MCQKPVLRLNQKVFGWAFLNDEQNAEWGYISLAELESVGAFKETGFKPKKAGQAIKQILKEVK